MDPNKQTSNEQNALPSSPPVEPQALVMNDPQVVNPATNNETLASPITQIVTPAQPIASPELAPASVQGQSIAPAPAQSSPVVSGPVVGGVAAPELATQQLRSQQNPLKKLTRLKLAIVAAVVVVMFGGGAFAYFGLFKDAEMSRAMKASDAFLKALDEGDEKAVKKYSEFNETMSFGSDEVKQLSESINTDLKRYTQDYQNLNGTKRALATYEIRIEFYGAEVVHSWVNLLEKRQGKWVVVNMGPVKDKNTAKLSDFSDKVFSGDQDITTDYSKDDTSNTDTERQVDIKAMHGQVEAYFAQNGYYPTFDQMNDDAFRKSKMRGLDDEALKDPDGTQKKLSSTPRAKAYAYQPLSESSTGCDNITIDCATYVLTATLSDGSTFTKEALN